MNLELALITLFKWITRIVTAVDFIGYIILFIRKIDGIMPPDFNLNVLVCISFCLLFIICILCIYKIRMINKELISISKGKKL
jgi:hypothetical protein